MRDDHTRHIGRSQVSGAAAGEIIVTAQKREQNLQDVPLAISAISAEKVSKLGISDSRDLSGLAPNVTITQGTTSSNAAVISIRGIPTPASETFGLDTSNGLYVDGVYIARSGASALDVMDVERIEVIRGPGAALWGTNAMNGVINIVTRTAQASQGTLLSTAVGSGELSTLSMRQGGGHSDFNYGRHRTWGRNGHSVP